MASDDRGRPLITPSNPEEAENGAIVTDQTLHAHDFIDVGEAMDGLVVGGLGPTGRPMPNFPVPQALPSHGPARIIAMANQKGGVGKTTNTVNLGAALADYGRRVLLVDFDPQGALSVGLGVNPHNLDLSIYNILMDSDVTVEDIRIKTDVAGLHLLPANIDLSAAEIQLVTEVAREMALARILRPVLKEYDYILI